MNSFKFDAKFSSVFSLAKRNNHENLVFKLTREFYVFEFAVLKLDILLSFCWSTKLIFKARICVKFEMSQVVKSVLQLMLFTRFSY